MQSAPYLIWRKRRDDDMPWEGNKQFDGYCFDLAEKIFTDILKMAYQLRIVKDGMYGAKDKKTQKWNGMIGELTEGVSVVVFRLPHAQSAVG